jgi:hypothetical protein
VEEAPGIGKGRERWWRFVPKDRRFPERAEQSPEMRAALDDVMARQFAGDLERFAAAGSGCAGTPAPPTNWPSPAPTLAVLPAQRWR